MNFKLNEEQQLLQQSVREFCNRQIVPHAAQWDADERFPMEVIAPMAELGLLGMQIPTQYGGGGMSAMDYVVALEEVARADASIGLTMASHNSLCTGHIFLAGNEEQRRKYVPPLASGKVLGAWGLTEPGSGSDAGAARTRAERRTGANGETLWSLTGSKTFITQGSVATYYTILASTSPEKKQKGLTAFVVEKGTPGFSTGRKIEKMGLHASDTTELILEDVVIPDSQRLGEIDSGFFDTLRILDKGRVGIGSWAVGIGTAAYEASKRYAKDRVQFGRPIADFQGISFMLADMATELDAARLMVWKAAWMQDQGMKNTREASQAKYYAGRAAMRACNSAIQIHGGYGYTREFPVERYFRDAKLAEIGEGTNEVQKMVIARELLKDVA
ncbi:MAG: acyl-CoA dehydrogenase family protein [Deltaproteobacteria bacterium]|nr:acyl-CoA dehydrogenase family protein [Deltaproteobacteria bacterium]